MSELNVFHYDDNGTPTFEELGKANGSRYWLEEDLQKSLGYVGDGSFRKAVMRAMQACLSLGFGCEDNFILKDGKYRLTRFACYLVAMNGDSKKPEVAAAQLYFAALAETFQNHVDHAEGIDRLLVRDEVKDGMKSLQGTAKSHGVQNYAFFMNAGYRGMYNMDLTRLASAKGLRADERGKLLDRMNKEELAANLFRITQTDAKIKLDDIRGQRGLETAAFDVGQKVRKTMMDISGVAPENLPLAEPIQEVKKKLKLTNRKFKMIDGKQVADDAEEAECDGLEE